MQKVQETERKGKLGSYLALIFWSGILLIPLGIFLGSINALGYLVGIIGVIIVIGTTIFSLITFPIQPIP